jgi:hypothetical protein
MGKRGTRCSICSHDKHRVSIELGIVHGVSASVLAQRFGVSKFAIIRHAKAHLSPVQRAALLSATKPSAIDLEALKISESEGLLHALVTQRARLHQHSELAASLGDIKGAVQAENSIQSNLSLVARLLGQLATHHNVTHTSLLVSPDYLRLRQALVGALRPYPEAGRAVAAALYALESDAAKQITAAAKPPLVIEHQAAPATLPPPPC